MTLPLDYNERRRGKRGWRGRRRKKGKGREERREGERESKDIYLLKLGSYLVYKIMD